MFGIGLPEMAVLLAIVLLVFGAGRLPEVGKALGLTVKNLKAGSGGEDQAEGGPRHKG